MSIYVRPVREQIEHDRVIRHLQGKLKRKFDVAANVGTEQQAASVRTTTGLLFPDLVLTTTDRSKRLAGVVEVETSESVHHLEAMAQWAPFGRLKVPFHLYVPATCADIAKRLAADLGAHVTELWTYHAIGDQIRLTLNQRSAMPSGRGLTKATVGHLTKPVPTPTTAPAKETKPAPTAATKPALTSGAKAAPKPAPKPGAKPKTAASKPARKAAKTAKRPAKTARPKARAAKPAPRKTARKAAARRPAGRVAKRR